MIFILPDASIENTPETKLSNQIYFCFLMLHVVFQCLMPVLIILSNIINQLGKLLVVSIINFTFNIQFFFIFTFRFEIFSKVPAYLNVVDIAGLVKGAAEGQGLGNAFLSHISACDAIFHLCRKFFIAIPDCNLFRKN